MTFERLEHSQIKASFEVSAEEFAVALDEAFKICNEKVTIDGFRKGKAPKSVYLKRYGVESLYADAIDAAVSKKMREELLTNTEIQIASQPMLDVDYATVAEGQGFNFTLTFDTFPEVVLGEYKGVKVKGLDNTVTEAEIANEKNRLLKDKIVVETKEEQVIALGDIAVFDFLGTVDGVAFDGGKAEGHSLELGSGQFIPGFEDQIIGAKIDDLIDVNVTFPEEYHAEELKGKPAVFKVKVNEIKVRELPELDDDFASEVSEFDTLAEYKADVRAKLEEKAKEKAEAEIQNAVVEKAVENAEFDLPDAMVEGQIDSMINDMAQRMSYQGMSLDMYMQYTGQTIEQMRETYREQAAKQVSGSLVIDAISKAEGIEISPEEVEMNLVDMAKKYNMEVDKLKELIAEPEMENIKKDMVFTKTIEMLANNAVVE